MTSGIGTQYIILAKKKMCLPARIAQWLERST